MGLTRPTVKDRKEFMGTLGDSSRVERERRKILNAAIEWTSQEFHGIGVEMNHCYMSNPVCLSDEIAALRTKDFTRFHRSTTFPGHRLPHAR
jgi:hypothetical protein